MAGIDVGKGADFENECCRYLSRWISDGEHSDIFMRNRVRPTRFTPQGEMQLGDIVAHRHAGLPLTEQYCIECKIGYSLTRSGAVVKNKQWDVLECVDGKIEQPTIYQFWDQCKRDAEQSHRKPLLIFKRDYRVPCVAFRVSDFSRLQDWCGFFPINCVTVNGTNWEPLMIMERDLFFGWLMPEIVRKMYNKMEEAND